MATEPFLAVHPRDLPKKLLPPRLCLGAVDPDTIEAQHVMKYEAPVAAEKQNHVKPPLEMVLNAFDFEHLAKKCMSTEGWAYYSSGADDEITLRENRIAFQRIWLKPRILVDVSTIDMTIKLLAGLQSIPLYITATALAKLADPEGELAIVRAAAKCGIPYMLPTLSSYSLEEMLAARTPGQVLYSQIYVNQNRQITYDYIEVLERNGVSGLFITVDAPQLGRREKDMRNKFQQQGAHVQEGNDSSQKKPPGQVDRSQGVARAISSFIDPSLDWKAIEEIRTRTKLNVYLKGVQTVEDAVLAYEAGVAGIVLSNHGGRQLDLCRSGIEILPEVMQALKQLPDYDPTAFEVFVDGGVKRGSDVFKAVALGAKAVGIGRAALYALASYGEEGIIHLVDQLFKEELTMCMRLMGTPTIKDLNESHVCIRNLPDHFATQGSDNLSNTIYEPLIPLGSKI